MFGNPSEPNGIFIFSSIGGVPTLYKSSRLWNRKTKFSWCTNDWPGCKGGVWLVTLDVVLKIGSCIFVKGFIEENHLALKHISYLCRTSFIKKKGKYLSATILDVSWFTIVNEHVNWLKLRFKSVQSRLRFETWAQKNLKILRCAYLKVLQLIWQKTRWILFS